MKTHWLAAALCGAVVTGCRDQTAAPEPGVHDQNQNQNQDQKKASTQGAPAALPPRAPEGRDDRAGAVVGKVVACRPGSEVEEVASRLMDMADTNGDGKISKDEARATTNFVLGGFFFRADTNGDGTVTPDEGRQARADLLAEHPALASLLGSVRAETGVSPFARLAEVLDVDYGKPLTMAEARDASGKAVDDLFGVADADKDGVLTVAEARSAAWRGAQALGHSAFQSADTDKDGLLSAAELQAAVQSSAKVAFDMADTTGDGKLTEDEAAGALGRLAPLLGVRPPSAKKP